MKFLIINYEYPPLGGGAGNATAALAKELVALGHEPCVLTAGFGDLPAYDTTAGFPLVRVRSKRSRIDRSSPFEMIDFVRVARKVLPKILEDFTPDHTIAFFALPSGLLAYQLLKKNNIPYTISLRGGDVPGFLPKNLSFLHKISMPLTKIVWKNAERIVANSRGLQELAEKTAVTLGKSVAYIPNGVDTKLYTPDSNSRTTEISILFVGRLTEQKGVTYLLKACAEINTQYSKELPPYSVTIAGDGPLREKLETEASSRGLSQIVHFVGWKSRAEIVALYQKAHIFVLPSFDEGMPNVILEAMASGLPIVATDIRGNNELVETGKNGILYAKEAELTECLRCLLSDTALIKRYGVESRLRAETLTWSAVARAYANNT